MEATTIAIDLAKDVFQIAIQAAPGRGITHRRVCRRQFASVVINHPPAHVVMEACATSHHWARRFREAGHRVTLLPTQYVRPYRRRNKTDKADATALLEAARNPEILPVAVKTPGQQAVLRIPMIVTAHSDRS